MVFDSDSGQSFLIANKAIGPVQERDAAIFIEEVATSGGPLIETEKNLCSQIFRCLRY